MRTSSTNIHYRYYPLDIRITQFLFLFLFLAPTLLPFRLYAAPPENVKLAKEQILHRGNYGEPQSLDPHKSEGVPSSKIQEDLFEGLTTESLSGDIIPGIATSWEISEDKTQYIFKLRKDARWSNGDLLTAHDFVYSWRRVLDPQTASRRNQLMFPLLNAFEITSGKLPVEDLGVKALDDYTLEVKLVGPTPYFLGLLVHPAAFPVHQGAIETFGEKYARPGNLVSNGAYKLLEWEVNSHIKLERNTHYYNDKDTTIDTVFFYPINNANSELQRFRAGDLTFTEDAPISQIDWLKENMSKEFRIATYLGIYYYGLNVEQAPFKDNLKLRQALALTVDREIITDKLLRNGVIPAYSFVPKGTSGYENGPEFEWKHLSKGARLAKAKQLYKEAGYDEKNPLKIEFRYNTQDMHKKVGLAVAAMWKQHLGVITTPINQEWKVFLEVRNQKRLTQVYRGGWIGDYNDPVAFLDIMSSFSEVNNSGYDNKEYDRLLNVAAVETNPASRANYLKQAETILLADAPVIPIFYYVTKRLVSNKLGGYADNLTDRHFSRYMYILE
ncbi:peptide ABC transporter substrate-binding protein [Aurantivibrio infirmus]